MFCEFCYAFFGLLVFLWVGSKFNRHLQFIYAFVMFGYIFPTLAFLIFPFCRVFLKKYNGKGEGTKKTTTYLWSEINGWYFNINYTEIPNQKLYTEQCMYLIPHRSWSDFFVHRIVTKGLASNLARYLVLAVFPPFALITHFDKSIFWFKRSAVVKEVFYPALTKFLAEAILPSIINYPEGTRSTAPQPKPLKRGVIYYAYERKLPVQIIITCGNDDVINERKFKVGFGHTIYYSYGEVIKAENFDSKEAYFEYVEKQFIHEFNQVYSKHYSSNSKKSQ